MMLSFSIMSIRTTITLENDVLDAVKQRSRERGQPFRQTLNDLVRLAISMEAVPRERPIFKVRPFESGMKQIPGQNYDKTSELLEYLEGPEYR